jgi:hypothetical protein
MNGLETEEILVPHDPSRGPVKAVRRMLIHSSIDEIRELGLYERYCSLIDPATLAAITDLIGPGWLPVKLALAHYRTCDDLQIRDEDAEAVGARAGGKMQEALLVAAAKRTEPGAASGPWNSIAAFSRMGRRVFEGGSTQYVKLEAKKLRVESVGNPLFAIRYYRVAHVGFMREAFGSLGVDVTEVKLSTYRSAGAEMSVRLSWK